MGGALGDCRRRHTPPPGALGPRLVGPLLVATDEGESILERRRRPGLNAAQGLPLYFQWIIQDAGAPEMLALSNAVSAETP